MDDADKVIQTLNSKSAEPRAEFKHGLRNQVIQTANHNNPASLTFTQLIMNTFQKKGLLFGGGVISLALVGVFALVIGFNGGGIRPADKSAAEIFAAIQQAQSSNTAEEAKIAANPASETGANVSSDLAILPYFEPNLYYSNVNTSKKGPAAGSCSGMLYQYDSVVTSTSTNYSDADGNYYGKYVTKSQSGQTISYGLTLPTERYDYQGGSYAVKLPNTFYGLAAKSEASAIEDVPEGLTEPANLVAPVDQIDRVQPILPEQEEEFSIEDYFGEDAQILGQETIDGVTYYIASWSYQGYCDDSNSETKIYNKVWVDIDTLEFAKEEQYINSIDPANLIVTNTNKRTEKIVELAQVSNEFVFDLAVEVREVNPDANQPGTDGYNNAVIDLLTKQKLSMILIEGFDLQGAYSDRLDLPDPYAYQYDRQFYAAGQIGDKQYEDATRWLDTDQSNNPYLSSSFGNDSGQYISVDVYAAGANSDYGLDFKSAVSKTLSVDGAAVTVEWLDNPYGAVEETVDPRIVPTPDYEVPATFVARMKLSGFEYIIWINGFETEAKALSIKLTSLDATSSQQKDQILQKLNSIDDQGPIIAF